MFFLDMLCEDPDFLEIVRVLLLIFRLICIISPIILIVLLVMDFSRGMMANSDEEAKKNVQTAVKRVIMCIGIFLTPSILTGVSSLLVNFGFDSASCIADATSENISRLKEQVTLKREADSSNKKNDTVNIYSIDDGDSSDSGDSGGAGGTGGGTGSGSGSGSITNDTKLTSIQLNQSSLTLYDEQVYQLSGKYSVNNSSDLMWKSSNSSVLTVNSKGVITAKSVGNATVTAYSKSNSSIQDTCKVTVRKIKVLFVGSSFTNRVGGHGVPKVFVKLASNAGYDTEYKFAYQSGAPLDSVYKNNKSLINQSYDYIILQPNVYIKDVDKNLNGSISVIQDVLKKNSSVKAYFRSVWNYKNTSNSVLNTRYAKFSSLVDSLNKKFNRKVGLIEDGKAMYSALRDYHINVFLSDNLHQNEKGVYLINYCIISNIFHKDPSTFKNISANGYPKLSDSEHTTFIKIAKNYCYK